MTDPRTLPHYPITRTDRMEVLAALAMPDTPACIRFVVPHITALLSDYLARKVTHLVWTPGSADGGTEAEWLADGERWLPTDNLWGFGPHLSALLPVLALTTAQAAALDRNRDYYIPVLLESAETGGERDVS